MGGLFLAREEHAGGAFDTARTYLAGEGSQQIVERRVPGWTIFAAPYSLGGPTTLLESGDNLVAIAGTLAFDGHVGAAALEALLAEADPPLFDWSRIGGQFVLLLRKGGRTFLATDYFGAFHVYHDSEMRFLSTSLLAAASVMPRVSFDRQGVYDYAFQMAVLGDDTVFAELKRVGPHRVVELLDGGVRLHAVSKPLPGEATRMPPGERIAVHERLLKDVVAGYARHFGDHIQCPLSGGLDSRLVLSTLRALGRRPHVYVYGPPSNPDVPIARGIGEAEGFDVEWIEKDRYREITPDEFPDQVRQNFLDNDGLPNFGGIFDNGGNGYAREARHRGGALAVSGGGGEIYRNFFYLPDRRLTAKNVVESFFSRFDPRDTTAEFDAKIYRRGIEDKILDALERPGDRSALPRSVIEQIYPRVRCRSLFGREISVEARYSPYLMPFLDHRIVGEALRLPMRTKAAGQFEASLLEAIDPVLAGHPSAYGHDFSSPPSLCHRFDEWATRIRPIWLRRSSYAIQRRLRPLSDEHGGLFGPDYIGRVIDLDFPAMRRFFAVGNVTDSGLWRRIACLEYLASWLGSRLVAG